MPRRTSWFTRATTTTTTTSAQSQKSRATSSAMAPLPSRKPQSQPMMRSTELHWSSEEEESGSPPSDDSFSPEPTPAYHNKYPLSPFSHAEGTLRGPLEWDDPTLICMSPTLSILIIGVADFLCKAVEPEYEHYFTAPEYGYKSVLCKKTQRCSTQDATLLAVHDLVTHSALPVDTFIIAGLIVKELGHKFYQKWQCRFRCGNEATTTDPLHRPKELLIMSAIVSSQFIQC
jgi:hypothetical protein